MSTTPQNTNAATSLELLRSIDATLRRLADMIAPLVPKPVASDRDLDGKFGDPEIRTMPRDWHGPDYARRRFSECPADLLDLIAEMHDYFAEKAERENRVSANGNPVAPYERSNAARARGWAQRIRTGKHTPKPAADATDGDFDQPADDSAINW